MASAQEKAAALQAEIDKLQKVLEKTAEVMQSYYKLVTEKFEPNVNSIGDNWVGNNANAYIEAASAAEGKMGEQITALNSIVTDLPKDLEAWAKAEAAALQKA